MSHIVIQLRLANIKKYTELKIFYYFLRYLFPPINKKGTNGFNGDGTWNQKNKKWISNVLYCIVRYCLLTNSIFPLKNSSMKLSQFPALFSKNKIFFVTLPYSACAEPVKLCILHHTVCLVI